MFEQALRASLPVIGVHTDDLVNLEVVLQSIANTKVALWKGKPVPGFKGLYYMLGSDTLTPEVYARCRDSECTLVVVNPEEDNPNMYDSGNLEVPVELSREAVEMFEPPAKEIPGIMQAVKGLSLKATVEVVAMAEAKAGNATARSVRDTRTTMFGVTKGLAPMDTYLDFYEVPPELEDWLKINEQHFIKPTKPQLVPRGLMLDGPPGVGKSAAAKYVANRLNVPAYRLDVVGTLDRWVGQSEQQVARVLAMAERESPCVVLLDEVEKLFTDNADTGVTQRILSQLLWWLNEHRSRVFTIMTTNDRTKIAPELYRPGRVDRVIEIGPLPLVAARQFAYLVYQSVTGIKADVKRIGMINSVLEDKMKGPAAHREIAQIVYDTIKAGKV